RLEKYWALVPSPFVLSLGRDEGRWSPASIKTAATVLEYPEPWKNRRERRQVARRRSAGTGVYTSLPGNAERHRRATCQAQQAVQGFLDGQELLFLRLHRRIHVLDETVGQLLHVVLCAAIIVLADLLVLQHGLDVLERVAADIADRHLGTFAFMADMLGEILAAFLGEWRHIEADHGTRSGGCDAEVGCHDGFFDGAHHLLFIGRNGQRARVRDGHGGDLVDRNVLAVVVHPDVFHQRGAGAAGAKVRQLVTQRLDALAHAGLAVAFDVVEHGGSGGC